MTAGAASVFDRVRFVLVEPQYAGNIGATARALKNLGFSRLVLVRPRIAVTDPEARRLAVDAQDLLAAARVEDELDAALEGAQAVIATSGRKGRQRKPHPSLEQIAGDLSSYALSGEVAVLFGREDHGLSDADLDRCTHLCHLDASPAYPSFNLSQAVLLVAYELRRATLRPPEQGRIEELAEHGAREAMYLHLQRALRSIGFVSDQTSESILRRLRRLFGRADLTDEDVQLLRGLARQTLWAAEQAGLDVQDSVDEPDRK